MNSTTGAEPAANSSRSSALRTELRACLVTWGVAAAAHIADNASLIAAGMLDSLALFNLVLWVERKTGRPVDPSMLDMARDWDSVGQIADYVERLAPVAALAARTVALPRPIVDRSTNVEIVRYTPTMKRAVAELQTALWSPDVELNTRYLEWKYERNPYASGEIFLAVERGALVGMRGFYGSCWQRAGLTPAMVLVADDSLLGEKYRNQRLMAHIMRAAHEYLRAHGHQLVLNLSGGALTVLSSLAAGWRSVGMLEPIGLVSPLRAARVALRRRVAALPYLWRLASRIRLSTGHAPFDSLDTLPRATLNGIEVEIARAARPAEMAELCAALPDSARIRHARDLRFFAWRFGNPLHVYRFLFAGRESLDGYLVLKGSDTGPRVSIVDLEARDLRTARTLLQVAVRETQVEELTALAGAFNPAFAGELTAAGFRPIDADLRKLGCPALLVRATNSQQPVEQWRLLDRAVLERASWDLRMIDTMAG